MQVRDAPFTKLCSTKNILTVNGQFSGLTLYVTKGETIIVDVYNKANYNITIHWHGVNQPRYPWSDGPKYITQCPIQPGGKFSQKPAAGNTYPFPKPDREVPIILGEWWKEDVVKVFDDLVTTGRDAAIYDSYLINGQPGDLHPCSSNDTFKLKLCEAIQSGIHNNITMDVLLHANQQPLDRYYMAAKAYSSALNVVYDNTTTTAIVEYKRKHNPSSSSRTPPHMPSLPYFNDTNSSINIISQMRSLADEAHPINVPMNITTNLFYTVSINSLPCPN
ncbi:hypothetical protein PIB30_035577, partial [Stylosanthes scabra]|nr:hypothetical protein [Stylosanthes scabra]